MQLSPEGEGEMSQGLAWTSTFLCASFLGGGEKTQPLDYDFKLGDGKIGLD